MIPTAVSSLSVPWIVPTAPLTFREQRHDVENDQEQAMTDVHVYLFTWPTSRMRLTPPGGASETKENVNRPLINTEINTSF